MPVLGGARQKTNKKRKILGRKTKNIFYKVKDVPKFSGERKNFLKKSKKVKNLSPFCHLSVAILKASQATG